VADDLKIENHRVESVDRRKGISSSVYHSKHGDGGREKNPGFPSKYVKTQKGLQHVNINKHLPIQVPVTLHDQVHFGLDAFLCTCICHCPCVYHHVSCKGTLSTTLSPTLLDFGSTIYLRARSFGTVTFLGGQPAPFLPTHSHAGAGCLISVALKNGNVCI